VDVGRLDWLVDEATVVLVRDGEPPIKIENKVLQHVPGEIGSCLWALLAPSARELTSRGLDRKPPSPTSPRMILGGISPSPGRCAMRGDGGCALRLGEVVVR
jgi:hypothetical protein